MIFQPKIYSLFLYLHPENLSVIILGGMIYRISTELGKYEKSRFIILLFNLTIKTPINLQLTVSLLKLLFCSCICKFLSGIIELHFALLLPYRESINHIFIATTIYIKYQSSSKCIHNIKGHKISGKFVYG